MKQPIPHLRHLKKVRRVWGQPMSFFNQHIRNQRQRRSFGVALGLVILLGAGCTPDRPTLQATPSNAPLPSSSTTGPGSTTSTPTSAPTTAESGTPSRPEGLDSSRDRVPADPTLEVVAPGTEPRLQISVPSIDDQSVNLVLSDVREIALSQDSVDAPRLVFGLDTPLLATRSAQSGTTRLHIGDPVILAVSGPATMLELAETTAASLSGLWFDQKAPSRLDVETEARAPVADLALAETFLGFIEAFGLTQVLIPDQELGVGASWQTEAHRPFGGLPATVTTRATVLSIDELATSAQVTIEVVFEPGIVELPSGAATLIDGATVFNGEVVWTSQSPIALFDLAGSSDLRMEISDSAGSTIIHQSVVQTYSLRLG